HAGDGRARRETRGHDRISQSGPARREGRRGRDVHLSDTMSETELLEKPTGPTHATDTRRLLSPYPFIEAKRALSELPAGSKVEVVPPRAHPALRRVPPFPEREFDRGRDVARAGGPKDAVLSVGLPRHRRCQAARPRRSGPRANREDAARRGRQSPGIPANRT